jgi:hypothetical protein
MDFEPGAGAASAATLLESVGHLFEGTRVAVLTLDANENTLVLYSHETVDSGFAFAAAAIKAEVTDGPRSTCSVRTASGPVTVNLRRCADGWWVEGSLLS